MALLHDLLLHLGAEQLNELQALTLTPTEREVFSFVAAQKRAVFPTALALQKLKLTQTHFEKVCSVVLKKIVLHLGGAEPMGQLNFIRSIGGAPRRLIRQQMKLALKQSLTGSRKYELLQYCFNVVAHFPVTELDPREVAFYEKKLLEAPEAKGNIEAEISIKVDSLYARMNAAGGTMQIADPGVQQAFDLQVEQLMQQALASGNPRAEMRARMLAGYYYQLANRLTDFFAQQQQVLRLTTTTQGVFTADETYRARLTFAMALAAVDRFEESYNAFLPFLQDCHYNLARLNLAEQSRFFKVALTTGHFDTAELLLRQTFAFALEKTILSHRVMASLQYIGYYLHTGALVDAAKFIERARAEIHKGKLLQYEIQLRYFENALLFLKGDLEDAFIQAEKNLKFLRAKQLHKIDEEYTYFFIAIKALYNWVVTGKKFNDKQQKAYNLYRHASWAHLGGLLDKMKQMRRTAAQ